VRISVVPFELDMQDAAGRLRGHDERPSGMHLSDVVRDLAARTIFKGDAKRKRVKFAQLTDEERRRMANYVELGFAWEWLFERAFEERQLRRVSGSSLGAGTRVVRLPGAKDPRRLAALGDPNIVYIGRPSKWGNPFSVEQYGRAKALQLFEEYLRKNPKVIAAARGELVGKTLACYCAPQPCHGDILVRLAGLDARVLDRNVVLKKDGLWMSPDAVDEAAWELWEFKLTWKTARRLDKPSDIASDPAFAEWLMQIKGYLHGLRMTTCNLVVFFVNGDYREPRVPKPAHLRLVFDKSELAENWTKIQNHRRTMEREARVRVAVAAL